MEQNASTYTPIQVSFLEHLGAALASVPEDKRKNASNEAAAYIRGFASDLQSAQVATFRANA